MRHIDLYGLPLEVLQLYYCCLTNKPAQIKRTEYRSQLSVGEESKTHHKESLLYRRYYYNYLWKMQSAGLLPNYSNPFPSHIQNITITSPRTPTLHPITTSIHPSPWSPQVNQASYRWSSSGPIPCVQFLSNWWPLNQKNRLHIPM